jgi:hypothetical protein
VCDAVNSIGSAGAALYIYAFERSSLEPCNVDSSKERSNAS